MSSCFNTFDRNFTIKESGGEIFLGSTNCAREDPVPVGDVVHGTLRVSDNTAFVEAIVVFVDESAIFHDNTGRVVLRENTVEDDLLCHGNTPKADALANTVGGTNRCGG